MNTPFPVDQLVIEPAQTTLIRGNRGAHEVFPFGAASLAEQHRWHMPPSEAAIEYAIVTIEDVLAKVRPNADAETLLAVHGQHAEVMADLLLQTEDQPVVTREAIERLFTRFANVVGGRPATVEGIPADTGFAAFLLIVREVVHHLNYAQVMLPLPGSRANKAS